MPPAITPAEPTPEALRCNRGIPRTLPKKPVVKLHGQANLRHRVQAGQFASLPTAETCLAIARQVFVSSRLTTGGRVNGGGDIAGDRARAFVPAAHPKIKQRFSVIPGSPKLRPPGEGRIGGLKSSDNVRRPTGPASQVRSVPRQKLNMRR